MENMHTDVEPSASVRFLCHTFGLFYTLVCRLIISTVRSHFDSTY